MSEEKKKSPPGTLDEFMDELRTKNVSSLDEAFAGYDAHMDKDNQKHLMVNVFGEGVDNFYNALKKGLESHVGDDTTTLKGHEDGVKKAVVDGIRAYLEKVSPRMLEKLLGNLKDPEDQYKVLVGYMNSNSPLLYNKEGKPVDLGKFIDDIVKDKKKKVNDLKVHFLGQRDQTIMAHRGILNQQYEEHLFGTYKDHEIVAHVRPMAEGKYKIVEEVDFLNIGKDKAKKLYRHIKHNESIEDLSGYGMEQK